jgi:2-beta-glucuronyltransferase
MKRVILFTGHYFESKRKAGFHWLADAYWRMGWEVIFVTVSISWLSWLRKDYRFEYPILKERNKLKQVKDNLFSYILFTPWHPANLRNGLLNFISEPLFSFYGKKLPSNLEKIISNSDLIIFESTPGLLLFERVKQISPNARFVYRVSDDLRLLKNHPIVIKTEEKIASQFDLISIPSSYTYERFKKYKNAVLHYHGIRKDLFDKKYNNPYKEKNNLIFVGNSHFDYSFIEIASQLFPKYNFHIIGPIKGIPNKKNIYSYGEMPFIETIPYIKHADVGLHTLSYKIGAESFTDSLKVIQYTYCKLPIIAPNYLQTNRKNMFYYKPGEPESIKKAILDAILFDRANVSLEGINSWDELAMKLLEE